LAETEFANSIRGAAGTQTTEPLDAFTAKTNVQESDLNHATVKFLEKCQRSSPQVDD
jgi:hypothetical protein